MNIAELPPLPPVETGYRLDPTLPVIALGMQVARAGCAAAHAHPRGQLIYACRGVMKVICTRDVWVVPPSQAVWVPPGVEHQVYFPGEVSLRNLFVDPSAAGGLPDSCRVLQVTPLLRELILRAVELGDGYAANAPAARLVQVVLDEIARARATELCLPTGRDARLRRVVEALQADPADPRTLDDFARLANVSARTLARLFVQDTGLTFGEWRQRLRLQTAIERLGRGESVTSVALALGYNSISAFISMFRALLGVSPGRYRAASAVSAPALTTRS